jgi:hypothetical protein
MKRLVPLLALLVLAAATACDERISASWAHDADGHWGALSAAGKAPPKAWWDALASGKGLCCSFADGQEVRDADWDTQGGHYRVRIAGAWLVVPDDAIVSVPNEYGKAVAWPYTDASGGTAIRCFLPGAGA